MWAKKREVFHGFPQNTKGGGEIPGTIFGGTWQLGFLPTFIWGHGWVPQFWGEEGNIRLEMGEIFSMGGEETIQRVVPRES